MSDIPVPKNKTSINPSIILLAVLPLLALAGVILLFLNTGGGLQLSSPVPVEALTFERTTLEQGKIILNVRNSGAEDLTIAQVVVNAAVWPFTSQPSATIPRLGQATIEIPYHWTYAEAYDVTLFSSNSVAFSVDITVAFKTPKPSTSTFLSFTLIGLYVGVIRFIGHFWLRCATGQEAVSFHWQSPLGCWSSLASTRSSKRLISRQQCRVPSSGPG
jgi:hypothetical protein